MSPERLDRINRIEQGLGTNLDEETKKQRSTDEPAGTRELSAANASLRCRRRGCYVADHVATVGVGGTADIVHNAKRAKPEGVRASRGCDRIIRGGRGGRAGESSLRS